ncbi:hypothetical protein A5821_002839 [Enterococcus sp. 7F3_DIV0205]|uniref:DUF3324 domain-containing protein n=1 Tax=Candidatus Enterococcus palustris TaxID=1834189 RepID=A0AAQ3WBR1_9ENTE|nr:DUF916 and DUF3324 domain-containing protein [Enterococcus sp. 7F3_DIV0205]OTN83273.1 hypothetical protein A5821_003196 [Enterococcus sp. 7F3_DIV0205]
MKLKRTYMLFLMMAMISIISTNHYTYAKEPSAQDAQGATGFYYELNYPENQKEENGYFDLKMTPGQKQEVSLLMKNLGEKELTIGISLNGTRTNSSGVIEYGPSQIEKDASLKFDFVDLVNAPETVTLAPKEEKTVPITITMPETSYDGIIVGGIQLKTIEGENQEEKPAKEGANIANKYAYVIAMVLQETDKEVKPELALNKVEVGQFNYRNTIFVDVSNTQAAFLRKLSMEVQITPKGKAEVLYETKKSSINIAPNTFLHFPVTMNGEKMVPGTYTANILAKAGDQKWTWQEDFTITDEQADKFNQDDVDLVREKGVNWPLIIGVAVGIFVLVIGLIGGIRFMNTKKKKTERKNRKK